MSEEDEFYVLSCEGRHEQDIRGVAALGTDGVATASRDRTAATWSLSPLPGGESRSEELMSAGLVFTGHEDFVNCVQYHPTLGFAPPTGSALPLGYLLSAGNDKHVLVWSLETGQMVGVLDGHSKPVKCITVLPGGDIVTGSWDHTLCVWRASDGYRRLVYNKHSNSVLCCASVAAGSSTLVLSGGGDRTIRLWNADSGDTLKTFTGHKDVVQSVAPLNDGNSFLSTGNDCQIIQWNLHTGECLRTLAAGHNAFIYSLAVKPDSTVNEFCSASEDRTVKVWKDFTCVQTIEHPRLVWTATYAMNNELVTAGEDGVLRVWTTNIGQMASQERLDALQQQIDEAAAAKSGAGAGGGADSSEGTTGGETDDLPVVPSVEMLQQTPGERDGVAKLVPNGANMDVYVWSAAQEAWQRVGTKVSAPDTVGVKRAKRTPGRGPKATYKGREYDYVFDVDFNGAMLQLPYNAGENIYDAAQNFITDYAHLGISQMDKESIVKHIADNVDPEDLALVGGAPSTSAGRGGGGGPPDTGSAFSAFAQESAALRAQGVQESKSYMQRLKELQEEGGSVEFSGYAREQAELRRQQQAGGSGTADQDSASNMSNRPVEELVLQAQDPEDNPLFQGLPNPELAAQKLKSLLQEGNQQQQEAQQEDWEAFVHHCVGYTKGTTPLPPPMEPLANLVVDILPPGSKVVGLDLLRLLASTTVTTTPAGGSEGQPIGRLLFTIGSESCPLGSDNEKVVYSRWLANCARSHPQLLFDYEGEGESVQLSSVVDAFRRTVKPNALGSKQTLRDASFAFLKNLSLALASTTLTHHLEKVVDSLLGYIAECFIYETGTKERTALLRCVLTLVHSKNSTTATAALVSGPKYLLPALKTLKSFGGDPVVLSVAKQLYRSLNPDL